MKVAFIGEGITPEDTSFTVSQMAAGKPGLPEKFSWKDKSVSELGEKRPNANATESV